jgi:DhnA family fructose-bisphosphate aldolase class Ia
VFQHQNPTKIVGALCMMVHEDASVEEALGFLDDNEVG